MKKDFLIISLSFKFFPLKISTKNKNHKNDLTIIDRKYFKRIFSIKSVK